jgi:ferritin
VLVRVFSPEEGERIRALGGEPVVEADAAAEQFLEWFERSSLEEQSPRNPRPTT